METPKTVKNAEVESQPRRVSKSVELSPIRSVFDIPIGRNFKFAHSPTEYFRAKDGSVRRVDGRRKRRKSGNTGKRAV